MQRGSQSRSGLASRVGAASIYLVVGLFLGLATATAKLLLLEVDTPPPFAAMVFGVASTAALLAAAFPRPALDSMVLLAHFAWGLLNGVLVPESTPRPEEGSTARERLYFWLGLVVGCCLLLFWLLS